MSSGSSIDGSVGGGGRSEAAPRLAALLIDAAVAESVAATFGMLADPTRARLLHALSLVEELRVSDLARLLGMSQSAVSHQLRSLRDNHVVARRRAGRVAYYRLADQHVRHILADALRHAVEPHPSTGDGDRAPAEAG